jgi:hypothetical protein
VSRQISIMRDGNDLGAWPYDVVFALYRCGSLLPTDTYLVEGMDAPAALIDAFPPSPSRSIPAEFLGRDDDESAWTFYCRDGHTVIGPRPIDEIFCLVFVGALTDDHLIFLAGSERWVSVADFMRAVEKEAPGTLELAARIREVVASSDRSSIAATPSASDTADWLERGLNLSMLNPHIGGAFLGFKAFKRVQEWLREDGDRNV